MVDRKSLRMNTRLDKNNADVINYIHEQTSSEFALIIIHNKIG